MVITEHSSYRTVITVQDRINTCIKNSTSIDTQLARLLYGVLSERMHCIIKLEQAHDGWLTTWDI